MKNVIRVICLQNERSKLELLSVLDNYEGKHTFNNCRYDAVATQVVWKFMKVYSVCVDMLCSALKRTCRSRVSRTALWLVISRREGGAYSFGLFTKPPNAQLWLPFSLVSSSLFAVIFPLREPAHLFTSRRAACGKSFGFFFYSLYIFSSLKFFSSFLWTTCLSPLHAFTPHHHGFGLDCGLRSEHLRLVC